MTMQRNRTQHRQRDDGLVLPVNRKGRPWEVLEGERGRLVYDPDEVSLEEAWDALRDIEGSS